MKKSKITHLAFPRPIVSVGDQRSDEHSQSFVYEEDDAHGKATIRLSSVPPVKAGERPWECGDPCSILG